MTEIRVPTLGESVTEATIGKWFKKPGDAVAVDEPLVELETDKVTIEVPAPAAGVLADIAAKDGETVAVGALLGQIKDGAGAGQSRDRRAGRRPSPPRRRPPPPSLRAAPRAAKAADVPLRAVGARNCPPKPASMRPAVPGTGKDGRVTKGDMLAAIERAAAQPTPVAAPPPPCRCARRRRPTMPRAKSACA